MFRRRSDVQQFARECEAGLAGGAGEQAVVADAMEAARQDVEQEPTDELVGGERHDALAVKPNTKPACSTRAVALCASMRVFLCSAVVTG